jgi:hypothetical protein
MKIPPVFLRLTTNSCVGGVNEPLFVAPEDIQSFRPIPVQDLTRRDSRPVDGALVAIRERGEIAVLEPVEEVAELIGKAHHLAVETLDPNVTRFPGYRKQPWVETGDQNWINQIRDTRDGLNEMELYGEGEPPFSYTEVKDALFKATAEWDNPRLCAEHRNNQNYGEAVLTLIQAARRKREERAAPMRELRDLAGGMPSEPHGVPPHNQPPKAA